ncbi:la protein homolog [Neodiprion virginianus]|uniref:la protein homolog n=1 Tax=Neodiprion virginianus TaxID=2961670 RepID=UPI001EE710E7|nr:la protein homolog [Neodiprion virginianus]
MENGNAVAKAQEQTNATVSEVKDNPAKDTPTGEQKTGDEPNPELLAKVRNQIEFYFGDVNMQRDKFLIEQSKLDEGWIPMSVLLKFKMLASMTTDLETIIKALASSELMEVSEDKKKLRRSPTHPLPVFDEAYRKAQEERTVYAKGFPLNNTNIEKLKVFFQPYGPVENIVMRKYQDKEKKLQFKGSIFVQFKTLELATSFMEKESLKYDDTELIRKWSSDYYIEKTKEKEERRLKKAEKTGKKGDKEADEAEGEEDTEDGEKEKVEKGLPKGSVIHLSGLSEETTREDIKERLGALEGRVAFIDFKKGDVEGWARLQGDEAALPVFEKMENGKLLISGKEVTCRILEGEEEDKYLAKAKEEMANLRQKYDHKGKRGGRRGGRGGYRGGRKRRNSPNRDKQQPPAKKVAAAE